jgi:uncharacterized protein
MVQQPIPGSFVHIEIPTRNQRKTSRFYETVFGWKFREVPGLNYATFAAGDGLPVGLRAPFEDETDVLNYILVESIEETLDKIETAGGSVIQTKHEVPGRGWFGVFRDPAGTVQAIWEEPSNERS